MTAPLRPDRPSRNVGVVLDDLTLDAVDLVRAASPDAPSRSRMIRELVQFALALTLDPEAVAEFITHHTAPDSHDDHALVPLRDVIPAGKA